MGRCQLMDEEGRPIGIEVHGRLLSRRRLLATWRGSMVSQPYAFWTPEVWRQCGPIDEGLNRIQSYDLLCRFSQKYRFNLIDQVLATRRLHTDSDTEPWCLKERLEESIRISRRYWGSRLSLTHWQLVFSLACYRFNRVGRGLALIRNAQGNWRQRQVLPAIFNTLAAGMIAPEVAFYTALYPQMQGVARWVLLKVLDRLAEIRGLSPQTASYLDHTDPWPDGWVGPRLVISRETRFKTHALSIKGWVDLRYNPRPLVLSVWVEGREVGHKRVHKAGDFGLVFPMAQPLTPGIHTVEVRAGTWFVPHRFTRNGDYRPLSFRMEEIRFC
jgi:hypothetical protein